MSTTFIYALCEPHSRTVRYIGKANNPGYRFKRHLRYSSKTHTRLGNWLRSLLSLGEKPSLVVLREIPCGQWSIAEERYIRLARGLEMNLVNGTDGGEGMHNPSLETREKLAAARRGKKDSQKTRAKMSAAKKGKPRTPHSEETRLKFRLAKKGCRLSESHKASIKRSWILRKAAKI